MAQALWLRKCPVGCVRQQVVVNRLLDVHREVVWILLLLLLRRGRRREIFFVNVKWMACETIDNLCHFISKKKREKKEVNS